MRKRDKTCAKATPEEPKREQRMVCLMSVLAEQPFAALVSGPGNSGLPLAAFDDSNFEMRTRNRRPPR